MSKKFGKFLLFSAVAGASAYGAYHYLKTKENAQGSENAEDADDDFDDFSEDLDEEAEPTKTRSYVSLNLDKAEAIATEAFHKAKEVIVDSVNQVKETVKSVTENQVNSESNFTDLTALNKEKEAEKAAEAKTEEFFDDAQEDSKTDDKAEALKDLPKAEESVPKDAPSDTAEASPESTLPDDADKTQSTGKVEEFFDD